MDYQKEISLRLREIEQREGVVTLYACESGSRAWGFPSRDSDYDVRFLYLRPREWYLAVDRRRDVIECPIDDLLDISGWDYQKALGLLYKSNPPLLEWIRSTIVYLEQFSVAADLRTYSEQYFSPRSCIHHYLHMADHNYREYLRADEVRLKKYFYVLRPVLACMHIERTGKVPPIEFGRLLEEIGDGPVKQAILTLLEKKLASEELDRGPRIDAINEFLDDRIGYFRRYVENTAAHDVSWDAINGLFLKALDEVFPT